MFLILALEIQIKAQFILSLSVFARFDVKWHQITTQRIKEAPFDNLGPILTFQKPLIPL